MRPRLPTLTAVALLAACSDAGPACDLAGAARSAAGAGALDCGAVGAGESRAAVDACTVSAFRAGRAFYARFVLAGIGPQAAQAVVRDATGAVSLFEHDTGTGGGDDTLDRVACVDPRVTVVEGADRVTCGARGATTRVCGR